MAAALFKVLLTTPFSRQKLDDLGPDPLVRPPGSTGTSRSRWPSTARLWSQVAHLLSNEWRCREGCQKSRFWTNRRACTLCSSFVMPASLWRPRRWQGRSWSYFSQRLANKIGTNLNSGRTARQLSGKGWGNFWTTSKLAGIAGRLLGTCGEQLFDDFREICSPCHHRLVHRHSYHHSSTSLPFAPRWTPTGAAVVR